MKEFLKKYLILIVIVSNIFLLLIDSFFYPGFLAKHFLLDTRVIMVSSVLFLSLNQYFWKYPLQKKWRQINTLVLLPVTFLLILAATLGEFYKNPNFFYSLIHLNPFHLSYVLIFSWMVSFIYPLEKKITRKALIFSGAGIVFLIAMLLRSRGYWYFKMLVRGENSDDTVVEYVQFLFYFLSSFAAAGTSFILAKLKKPKIIWVLYLLGALGLFMIAGEEISWGQRIFGLETPEFYLEHNTQKEINLHNNIAVFGYVYRAYVLLSFYCAFAWINRLLIPRKIKKKIKDWLELFIPNWYFMGYFFISFMFFYYYRIRNYFLDEFEEFSELILVMGILGFCLKNLSYYWSRYQSTLKRKK